MSKDRATVQDQSREKQMIKILGLIDNESRLEHDAEDEYGHIFELKSSTKNSFGTARDVSIKMITKWRKSYWIFANGINYTDRFEIEVMYLCTPSMMKKKFDSMEEKFNPDKTIRNIVLKHVKKLLSISQFNRLSYLIDRGMTYNNPHISMKYVKEYGVEIDLKDPKNSLKKQMSNHL